MQHICMSEIDTGISITTSKNNTKLIYCRSPTIFRVSIVEMWTYLSTGFLGVWLRKFPQNFFQKHKGWIYLGHNTKRTSQIYYSKSMAYERSILQRVTRFLGQLFNISLSQVAVHIWDHPTKTASFWLLYIKAAFYTMKLNCPDYLEELGCDFTSRIITNYRNAAAKHRSWHEQLQCSQTEDLMWRSSKAWQNSWRAYPPSSSIHTAIWEPIDGAVWYYTFRSICSRIDLAVYNHGIIGLFRWEILNHYRHSCCGVDSNGANLGHNQTFKRFMFHSGWWTNWQKNIPEIVLL